MKSNSGVPKIFIVGVVVLVLFILFIFFVFSPFLGKIPKYQTDHASAVSTIAQYEDTLTNQKKVQERIDKLTESFNEKQEELFIDSKQSIEDLQSIFKKLNIDMVNLTRGNSVKDSKGRKSSAGYPLYSTSLTFSYEGKMGTTQELLDYLERESKGCYFVKALSMSPIKNSDNYNVSFSVSLYYFDTTVQISTKPASSSGSSSSSKK